MKQNKCYEKHIPNAETIKAIKETEKGIGLKQFDNVEELFKYFNCLTPTNTRRNKMSKNQFPETIYVSKEDDYLIANETSEECNVGLVAIYKLVEVKKLSFIPKWEEDVPVKKVKKVKSAD